VGQRTWIEAEKAAPEIAKEAIALVRALYAVERQGSNASVEDLLRLRRQESASVLAELREKFFDWKEQLLPKHPMAEAIQYAPGHWDELNVFLADGAVAIDNNIVTAARGSDDVMPTAGLCRATGAACGPA
jgi:transposase